MTEFREHQVGVPQGTLTGPQAWLVLINPLAEELMARAGSKKSKKKLMSLMYADDVVITGRIKNDLSDLEEVQKLVQGALDVTCAWCDENNLQCSAKKTVWTVFGSSKKMISKVKARASIKLGQKQLGYESEPVFLGVTLDERLKMDAHAAKVAAKL